MKQELKPVTTKDGCVLLCQKATGKEVDDKAIYTFKHEVDGTPWWFKAIVQPIGSKLDGIPYYQTEEEKQLFTEDDVRKAHFHGWFQRERYDGAVGKNGYEGKYPDNWNDMDYEEREEWFCNQLITSLRKPRRIVSATICRDLKGFTETSLVYVPITYTKEIDGKMLEFIKLDFVYE